jgi:hypothetical protein
MKHSFIYGIALIVGVVGMVVQATFHPLGASGVISPAQAQALRTPIAELDFELVGGGFMCRRRLTAARRAPCWTLDPELR